MCGFFPVHSTSCCRGVPQHRRVFRSARQLAEPPLRWPEGQLQQSARASPDAQQPPASARPPDDWWQQRAWRRLLWHPCKMSSTSACFFLSFYIELGCSWELWWNYNSDLGGNLFFQGPSDATDTCSRLFCIPFGWWSEMLLIERSLERSGAFWNFRRQYQEKPVIAACHLGEMYMLR